MLFVFTWFHVYNSQEDSYEFDEDSNPRQFKELGPVEDDVRAVVTAAVVAHKV